MFPHGTPLLISLLVMVNLGSEATSQFGAHEHLSPAALTSSLTNDFLLPFWAL